MSVIGGGGESHRVSQIRRRHPLVLSAANERPAGVGVRLARPEERTAAGAGEEGLAFDPRLPDGAFEVVGCAGVLDVQRSLLDGPMAKPLPTAAARRLVRDAQERGAWISDAQVVVNC